jgi:fermentation-respiration switch protein FrsA (DUF1100 family)
MGFYEFADPLRKAEVFASFPKTVHSKADTIIPPGAGEKLFNAAHEPRYLWMEENAPHLAIYLDNPRRYKKRLIGFFDEWLLGK